MDEQVEFPETRWQRLVDRIRHWWHARRVPLSSEPEDFGEPTVLDLLLDRDD